MKKLFFGRAMTYFALTVVLLAFIALIVTTAVSADLDQNTNLTQVWVDGKYSINGGEWQDTVPGKMTDTRFHTVTIKGTLTEPIYPSQQLVVFTDNILYELSKTTIKASNTDISEDDPHRGTPGCCITYIPGSVIADHPDGRTDEITVTLTYPYTMFSNRNLNKFFRMYVTDETGIYELITNRYLPMVIFFLLICFFGLIAFPIAGTVLGGINIRYLAFSLLCFFTGLHLIYRVLYAYLPLWIDNPFLCMSVCELTSHLLGICILIYIKVTLVEKYHKLWGNIVLGLFSLLVILLIILNQTGTLDLYASKPIAQVIFTACAILLTVFLFHERKENRGAKSAIITLIPLAVTLLYDTLNLYFGMTTFNLFEVGATLTLFYQIVNLIIDMRKQYKETIRYQQMQKELYESRVAIMVSQIQPHFLYNSLTSIAMMCSIDPDTAQEATITFADYLRGNMDSLKQKTPVPFTKELEHLKKYLYIEKLRFGDELNIAYDIQAEDFVLPQLSIQPLVENAVKHGVGMKREGGTVAIATRETEKAFEVIVSDDGVGFDTEAVKDDGRSHIGMDNVRRRLHDMCGGTVTITSKIGEGTVATVTLPKEGQKNEDTMR